MGSLQRAAFGCGISPLEFGRLSIREINNAIVGWQKTEQSRRRHDWDIMRNHLYLMFRYRGDRRLTPQHFILLDGEAAPTHVDLEALAEAEKVWDRWDKMDNDGQK